MTVLGTMKVLVFRNNYSKYPTILNQQSFLSATIMKSKPDSYQKEELQKAAWIFRKKDLEELFPTPSINLIPPDLSDNEQN